MVKICKFGGSVLNNANDIKIIFDIVKKSKETSIIIVSAFNGVTNKLLEIYNLAYNKKDYTDKINNLYDFHINIINDLNCDNNFENLFNDLKNSLHNCDNTDKISDLIVSFGERFSANIIYSYIKKYIDIEYIDARNIIKTNSNFGQAIVNLEKTNKIISDLQINSHIITEGFIASNNDNEITTLGRNGSDYSAAIIANGVNADLVEMWKDVDGLYSADPKIVPDAKFISKIDYDEIKELCCFGNKILHMNTVNQLSYRKIPIVIRSLYNIDNNGTLISNNIAENFTIKGVTQLKNIAIISLSFVYNDLNYHKTNLILNDLFLDFRDSIVSISEIVLQDSVSLSVKEEYVEKIVNFINNKFNDSKNVLCNIKVNYNKAIVTVVGSELSNQSGISAIIFNVLQKNDINIYAIQDDLSETRISFILDNNNGNNAIKMIHDELALNLKFN